MNIYLQYKANTIFQFSVDGGFSEFGDWSECSNPCGEGHQTRTRTCTNPAPAHGGADCDGEVSETQLCDYTAVPGLQYDIPRKYIK